jgi:polysaccharide biosynthesis protein VpsQ
MKYLTALFSIFILVVIVLADTDRLGFMDFIYAFPLGDKVGHFTLFGILTFLILLTVLRSRRFPNLKRAAVILTLLLALLIAAEEFSQNFFASRTFSFLDLFASYAGMLLGAWLAYKKR